MKPDKGEWVDNRAREIKKETRRGFLFCLNAAENEYNELYGNGSDPVLVGHANGCLVESKCPHCGGSLLVEVKGG